MQLKKLILLLLALRLALLFGQAQANANDIPLSPSELVQSAPPGRFVLADPGNPFAKLNEAVFSFRSDETGGACTASKISASGDALTAFHCLKECLIENGWFDQQEDSVLDSGEKIRTFRQTQPTKPIWCRTMNPSASVQVMAGPKCISYVLSAEGKLARVSESGPNNCDKSRDALIVRFPTIVLASFQCAPLSLRFAPLPETKVSVFSIGFPAKSNAQHSDGIHLYRSYGQLMHQNACELRREDGSSVHSAYPFQVGAMVLQSSITALHRSSGSPLLNDHGEVVGVVSGIYSPLQNSKNYCAGGVFSSRLQLLDVPNEIVAQNQACRL